MLMDLNRRSLLRTGMTMMAGSLVAGLARASEPPNDVTFAEDFDELWRTLAERYCYFGEKATDWNRVRALYRPMALAAESDEAFAEVLRQVLAELYDAHTHLSNSPDGAPRWPPYDMIVARQGDTARITAIRDDSAASGALAIGDVILSVGGKPVAAVAAGLMPRCLSRPDLQADDFAWNTAVAGRRGQERQLEILRGGERREVRLPLYQGAQRPDLEWRPLDGGIGYVAIRSFGEHKTAEDFDAALLALRDAPGLIIDVRNNGGGDTAVARPIMGRFIAETRPYAHMARRQDKGLSGRWTEVVEPKGPFTYTRPVVVLTNHWSGSMAEGFPMGMRGIGRATIVGTPMMGLGAAVFPFRLDRTGLQGQYSAEPVYDVQGRARSLMRPDVAVRDGEDILAAGIAALKAKIG